jgi:FixJ family two-component response regulator
LSRTPTVYVVDDDASTRELLAWLMKREGLDVQAFAEARAFLAAYPAGASGCLILDLNMPGMSGLDLQQNLKAAGVALPVIFLSGGADVPNAVRAVKEGAIDFIEKPFDYKQVVSLVRDCIARACSARPGARTPSAWRSSRNASARCWTSWSPARPTAKSPRRWTSA